MVIQRSIPVLYALSGILGAFGVGAAAAAAHTGGSGNLQTASLFLMVHATALVGIASAAASGKMPLRLTLFSGAVLALGTMLFSGDLALRGLMQAKLFVMAAPIGGTLMITGWALLAVSGIVALFHARR